MGNEDDWEIRKLYHRNGHNTEREAAELIAPQLGRLQAEVLAYARSVGERGFTQHELAEALPARSWSSYRSRVNELADKGLVYDTGERRLHPGRATPHIVWRATDGKPRPGPSQLSLL